MSAYYGKRKHLRDDTWEGVAADIDRRLASGELSEDLNYLCFADRAMTTEGWVALSTVLRRLNSCMSLELQRCGIKCVGKLIDILPELVHKTKRFNLEGNALSARNVRKLADAMSTAYAHIRPSWLSIGSDAQAAAATCLTETVCHPHHPRGCLCLKPAVVHVVQKLPKYDAVAKAAWEEKYWRPLQRYIVQQGFAFSTALSQPPNMDNWTAPPSSIKKCPLTPTTATPSCGGSPKEQNNEDEHHAVSHCTGFTKSAGKIPPASESNDAYVSQASCAVSPAEALVSYVRLEKRAHEMEIISRLGGVCGMCTAPLEAAARFVRGQASTASAHLWVGGGLSYWLLDEKLFLLAASTEGRLLLLDLAESASRGDVLDVRGAPACTACPLRDFNFRAVALPFTACTDQHELATTGGQLLEINKEHTMHLASGWVAARPAGAFAYLWFPLDHCCVDVVEVNGS